MAQQGDGLEADSLTLRDGSIVHLRSIRPDDEPRRLQDLLDHMSIDDIRRRFFAPIRAFSPALSWHLTHPDPVHEIALAALTPDGEALLGVARCATTDDPKSAEYAIVVRTDTKGKGLGYLLLRRLLARAAEHGIEEVWGDVLNDNEAMLKMCRELGFAIDRHPEDANLLRVRKRLSPSQSA